MVDYQSPALTAVFHAMADPTRRGMLLALSTGEMSVSELAAPFAMSLTGASKHLRTLEEAGLVRRQKRGRSWFCQLDASAMAEADEWIAVYRRFWTRRLDALERELLKPDPKPEKGRKT